MSEFLTKLKRELIDTVEARKLAYYGHTKGAAWTMQGIMPGARR